MGWGSLLGGLAGGIFGGPAGAAIGQMLGGGLDGDSGASDANSSAADANRMQAKIASQQWDRYNKIYAPMEDAYVKESQTYDSPENLTRAAGDASATVSSQFGKARDRLSRTPGMDPSTPGYGANLMGLELAQAATDATQQNAARQKVKDTAYARKTDALSLGKGLPAQASSMLGSASSNGLALAQFGQGQANAQAGAAGRVVDRVLPSMSNWLGNVGKPTGQTINPNSGEYLGSLEF